MAKFDPRQLAAWTGGVWLHGVPRVVDGISTDSRQIVPGNIFIAIRGPNFDGHNFVSSAFSRGASGAVVARPALVGEAPGPLLAVKDTAIALQQMAANYRQMLKVNIIAVTGSVGKTTVKEMIAGILSRRLVTAKTIGNWNNEYGLPLSILNMAADARVGVFELGVSHPGELFPLCRLLKPDWGVVTAIGPAHLEYFGSEKTVADEKSELLKNLPENGIAFLRCDYPWFELLRSAARGRVISVAGLGPAGTGGRPASKHKDADYCLFEDINGAGEYEVLERASGEKFRFQPPLPGGHMAGNALFAVAVARTHGFDWPVIREGLAACQPLPMRWQAATIGGVLVINDAYNANPMSMAASLRTFEELQHAGRKWLVLAGMRELGPTSEEEHKKLGLTVARFPWSGLVTVGPLGEIIAAAVGKAGMRGENIYRCADHSSAAKVLADFVRPGDAVLFKASRGERLEKVLEIWKKVQQERV